MRLSAAKLFHSVLGSRPETADAMFRHGAALIIHLLCSLPLYDLTGCSFPHELNSSMSDSIIYLLIGLVIAALFLLAYLLHLIGELRLQSEATSGKIDSIEIRPEQFADAFVQNQKIFEGVISKSWKELGIENDLGELKSDSRKMTDSITEVQSIFQRKQDAANWAELSLEEILKDNFSEVHFRKKLPKIGGVIPDAHMKLHDGRILCIDSKFPIEAFKKMEKVEDGRSRKAEQTNFLKAIRRHFEKVAEDYVKHEEGTTEIAYMYIASERIYEHLISPDNEAESGLMREAANLGVVICSPATLIANMHLIRIAERAMRISQKTKDIAIGHSRLQKTIDTLESSWDTLSIHILNANKNRDNVQKLIEKIKSDISDIAETPVEESD